MKKNSRKIQFSIFWKIFAPPDAKMMKNNIIMKKMKKYKK
jgi:hypothetical protein